VPPSPARRSRPARAGRRIPPELRNEDILLSALTDEERAQLTELLRKLLVSFEHERAAAPLGMVLAPAHVARRLRTSVGLSDTAGLLVTAVTPHSPAQHAGLQEGDLLTAVDGTALRSCVELAQRTHVAPGRPLTFTVLRGSEPFDVTVAAPGRGAIDASSDDDS
jgi:S1-C subfamily serine protease